MPEIVLETIGLTKDFRKRRAVDNLHLRVFDGDVYGFLGPNGAGKSTTIRMLTGLVRPTVGTARILGHDVRSDRVGVLKDVGALVELPAFYKYMTARENLRLFSMLSGDSDGRRIDEVLDVVGLLDRANDKVRTYSHGMLQRLGIAQALIPKPRLVILDEPTSGLDPHGMKDVRDLIVRLAKEEKVTVFLSSHLLHEVEQVCTRVGIINRGKLIAEGDVGELLRRELGLIEITVGNFGKGLKALAQTEGVEIMPSPQPRSVGGKGHIIVRAPMELVPEMNRGLVAAGVAVYSIVPKTRTLEDLFLEVVGENGHVH